MQYNFKLGRVVTFGFGSVFVVMVVIGIVSKLTTNKLVESNGWVSHTYQVEGDLEDITKFLLDAETGQRGFILTQKANYLEPYNTSVANFEKTFDEVNKLIQDNPEQVTRLNQVKQLAKDKMVELAETIELTQQGKRQEALNLILSNKGKQIMDEIRAKLAEMTQVEERLLADRQQTAKQAAYLADLVSLGGTTIAILFGSFVLFFIARGIVRPITQVANAIAASTTEIATTIEQQERTTMQQASSVNQTTTTMDELAASSRQSAEQAEASAAVARQVLLLVDGRTQEGQFSKSSLREKVGDIAAQILHLSEQTNQIGTISTLVSDLATQTNMLALNAAVEAVRAGEHGKGFAVVAAEIRKLADQSKRSAEKINVLVLDIQKSTNSTVIVTDEGTKTVEKIVDAIKTIAVNGQQISLTSNQQAIAVQQVVEAMNSLNIAARETASGISQIKVSTQRLNDGAQELKAVV
ncbi:CHASE3 domain-containing protein [Nostoc cf. edaphicum LEGE 07299]|uniref:CHASE3 domain-containing protein n=1 Tax=Nostoc cf. edaphicum LEGE 07299 TaxID=2777974 RepID=A0ABR9TX22_9NOSO|nr:CHASE3 domain-containing protein [Nostoc edaphicum]MBE9104962.1 CHASE3 domain-containing protein [Nostoc cf. edaphicum LEGE 07299]